MGTPWDADKQFADLFQIGTTSEMIGVKPPETNVKIKNVPVEVANDIWNAAIEEVIKEIEQWDKGCSPRSDIVPEIRKLKK